MGQLEIQFGCDVPDLVKVCYAPSPSIIAKRSAATSKSPSALTAVMLGKEGTRKYSPGGKASEKNNTAQNGIIQLMIIEYLLAYF